MILDAMQDFEPDDNQDNDTNVCIYCQRAGTVVVSGQYVYCVACKSGWHDDSLPVRTLDELED